MSSNHLPSGQAIRKGPGGRCSRSLGKGGGPRAPSSEAGETSGGNTGWVLLTELGGREGGKKREEGVVRGSEVKGISGGIVGCSGSSSHLLVQTE